MWIASTFERYAPDPMMHRCRTTACPDLRCVPFYFILYFSIHIYIYISSACAFSCGIVVVASETTDTGSAFSYFESSSVGRSVLPDGAPGALEAFTGPVYGLVAALLEQDMARAPRDKRRHRFLELFSLSDANSFQVPCSTVAPSMR